MNKRELVDEVAKDTELTKKEVATIIDAITEVVEKTVAKGERVSLVGFGTFSSVDKAERNGRNPKTGQLIKIKAKKVPKFHAGKGLKNV